MYIRIQAARCYSQHQEEEEEEEEEDEEERWENKSI